MNYFYFLKFKLIFIKDDFSLFELQSCNKKFRIVKNKICLLVQKPIKKFKLIKIFVEKFF